MLRTQTASTAPRNRTTVRSSILKVMSVLAPEAADQWVIRAFATPMKTPYSPPPLLRRIELVADGRTIAGYEGGTGPTVLLVHGWSGQASQWSAFIPALLEAGYHVVTFDMPAHGASAGERSNLVEFTRIVGDVASRFGGVHAVFGHSLGAAAVAHAVLRGVKAERMVLLASPARVEPFVARFAAALGLGENRLPALLKELERVAGTEVRRLAFGEIEPVTFPTLLFHDARDRDVAIDQARILAGHWPNARLVETSGLGHRKILFDAKVVAEAVSFLKGVGPSHPA